MFSPATAAVAVLFSIASTFLLLGSGALQVREYFFISVPLTILAYTGIAICFDNTEYQTRRWLQEPKRILGQYGFWGALIFGLYQLYSRHSFYSQVFPGADIFLGWIVKCYAIMGLPYFVLAEKFRSSTTNNLNDPYLLALAYARKLTRQSCISMGLPRVDRRLKTFVVAAILRMHFLALIACQLMPCWLQVNEGLNASAWTFNTTISVLIGLAWAIDGNNATIGYLWESKFTRTRFRKMDPYPLNWIVTLSCYVPFSVWSNAFLPTVAGFDPLSPPTSGAGSLSLGLDLLTIFFLFGYIFAGTSLCFSTSNLSYKAIQTRGPYAVIRHPATLFKISFFSINFIRSPNTIGLFEVFAFSVGMMIYIARIFCEERFLDEFPEYQEYKLRTRYRLIPGIF